MDNNNHQLNSYFFKNKEIYISKHPRFAPYPKHSHSFIEMNYVLQGTATEIINDKEITLNRGDLILINVGTNHAIKKLSNQDILINILFEEKALNLESLYSLKKRQNVLFDFLINNSNLKKDDFIIFRFDSRYRLSETIENLIDEYYSNKPYSADIIHNYLHILLMQIARDYEKSLLVQDNYQHQLVIKMLQQITEDYKNTSLKKIAAKLNYNRNYLSTVFKNITGKSFSTTLTEQRLLKAHELLRTTASPVNKIMTSVGINNKSFFYTQYKKRFGKTPNSDRL